MPTLPNLPVELLEVKLKLQSTTKTEKFSISSPSVQTSEVVIKTKNLFFDNGAELVFNALGVEFLIIYADVVTFNGRASVTRRSLDDLTGAHGKDAPRTPPTPRGQGRNGNNGAPGGNGGQAQAAPRMPVFFLFARQVRWINRQATASDVRGNVQFSLDGLDGGIGGNGGRGGDGTNGNKGAPSKSGLLWCDSGVGYGGRGGNAGAGGQGGFGSNGGDASTVYFFVEPQQHSVVGAFDVSTKGGRPGRSGLAGPNGTPGQGGLPGDASGQCNEEPGRKGANGGIVSGCRYPGIDLLYGANNPNSPAIFDYQGWDELQ